LLVLGSLCYNWAANVLPPSGPPFLQEFFSARVRAGEHYEPLRYDLGDVVLRSQQLLSEAQSDPGRLERMALAARDAALGAFNFEAQMDCFAWSVLKV
jgi:hypothetical protein